MKNHVKVAKHPETGSVITKNENKPEFGTIRVDQEVISMENGFLNKTKRSGFITGKLVDLQSIGYFDGKVLPGQIIRKESFTPLFTGQTPKINPTTKVEVLVEGRQIYFQDRYTEDMNAKDELLRSTVTATTEVVNETATTEDTLN